MKSWVTGLSHSKQFFLLKKLKQVEKGEKEKVSGLLSLTVKGELRQGKEKVPMRVKE